MVLRTVQQMAMRLVPLTVQLWVLQTEHQWDWLTVPQMEQQKVTQLVLPMVNPWV